MDTEQAKSLFETFYAQKKNEMDFLEAARQLFENGWKADDQAIADGVASGLAEAVKAATAPLYQQIADPQAKLDATTPPPEAVVP